MSTADQCREMGLAVGDTIQGREKWGIGWADARLTLIFLGERIAVFQEHVRSSVQPEWIYLGESAGWSLKHREWAKVAS